MLNKKRLVLAVFFIQIIVLVFGVLTINYVLRTGEVVKLAVTGFDPYDPIRGRYVYLNLVDDRVKINDDSKQRFIDITSSSIEKMPLAYIIIKNTSSSSSDTQCFDSITFNKPSKDVKYIKCDIGGYLDDEDKVAIYPRLDTYYVNEKLAPYLEDELRKPDSKGYMYVKVKNGIYVIDKIEINGVIY